MDKQFHLLCCWFKRRWYKHQNVDQKLKQSKQRFSPQTEMWYDMWMHRKPLIVTPLFPMRNLCRKAGHRSRREEAMSGEADCSEQHQGSDSTLVSCRQRNDSRLQIPQVQNPPQANPHTVVVVLLLLSMVLWATEATTAASACDGTPAKLSSVSPSNNSSREMGTLF